MNGLRARLYAVISIFAVTVALSAAAAATTTRGESPGDATTTTIPVDIGAPTSVTRTPAVSSPNKVDVKGERVTATDSGGSSWAWWLLLLLVAPAAGALFGFARHRLASSGTDHSS